MLTIATFGLPASSWPTVSTAEHQVKDPFRQPNLVDDLGKAMALLGVNSLGLMTMVFPVISAGASLRAIRKNGKFHGRIPVVTPSARLKTRIFSRDGRSARSPLHNAAPIRPCSRDSRR
jgi:hypothetical protein